MGSTIDPEDGVRLATAANAAGDRLEISVARGPFSLRQDPARPAVTELRLRVAAPTCGGSRAHARLSDRDASGELLVTVDHKGRRNKPPPPGGQRKRVSVRGKHSDGAADGTSWLTVERCDGTLTRVDSGVVRVRDFGLHKTVLVRAGHRYLARAR
jgi:hypothetical protein